MDYTKLLDKLNPETQLGGDPGLQLRTAVVTAVNSDSTASVNLNGVVLTNVPILNGVVIEVDSVVQMLSLRGSMLILGTVAKGLNSRAKAGEDDNLSSWTNTTPAAGSPAVSIVFVAPASGSVTIAIYATMQAVVGQVFSSIIVRTGATPGSGSVVYDGTVEPEPRLGTSSGTVSASSITPVDDLTPGDTYNVQQVHWAAAGGTGTLFARHMYVQRV